MSNQNIQLYDDDSIVSRFAHSHLLEFVLAGLYLVLCAYISGSSDFGTPGNLGGTPFFNFYCIFRHEFSENFLKFETR